MRYFPGIIARLASLLLTGFLLAGCAGMRIIETDVSAFSTWTAAPPAPGTTYRFERLPSQMGSPQQDRLEAITTTSLSRVGMALDPATARYSVQVGFNTQYLERFPNDGFMLGGPGFGPGRYGGGFGYGPPFRFGEPYYVREATLLMRELATQKVVFETHAFNDGVWGDTLSILPSIIDSALFGFPQPPPGVRRINVEIPR